LRKLLSLPLKFIQWLVAHPRLTVGIGVLFLIALVWIISPLIGMESVTLRIYLSVGILLLWLIFIIVDQYRSDRNAKRFEESLNKQAQDHLLSIRPDRKGKIESLKNDFEKAVASLKESKLGKGRKGASVLYALPWYMFIGPPASGKSTALLNSGLQFPFHGGAGKGIQGVGGTRNCDWWFTNDSVLLDTAGRYVTAEEDREEWIGFLGLLKKYRKEKPINGVLASISVSDLIQASDEEIEYHAKNIRARIDELTHHLGIVFPVYLLFTKCDLLRGFVEFFEDLGKTEREQVWGATFSRKISSTEPPKNLFDNEFRLLCQSLSSRRIARLSSAMGSRKIRDIYGFPLQLASCREKFTRFVEILFQPNPYKENPIFRGFYFTSGTQEGTPIDRILSKVSRASGMPDPVSESFEAQSESKSYFIKNLFTDVIFPDRILAGSSSNMARQRGYMRIGIFIGGVLLALFASLALFISFAGNEHLIASAEGAVQKVSQIKVDDERQFENNIEMLDRALVRLSQLSRYDREGAPFRLRLGLYRGSTIYKPLRAVYFEQFRKLFMTPTKKLIEIELEGFVANQKKLAPDQNSDYYYSLLKTYILMSEPAHAEPKFLDNRLEEMWGRYLTLRFGEKQIPKGLQEATFRQIGFYSEQSGSEGVPRLTVETRLVQDTREALQQFPLSERMYGKIKREGSEGLEPYTLDTPFGGKKHPDILTGSYQVAGLFTEKGLKGLFKETMTRVLEGTRDETWVLGLQEGNRADLEDSIEKLYMSDYASEWQKFLESVRIRPAESLKEAAQEIEVLAKEDSPIKTLLKDVARQTDFGSRAPGEGLATGLIEKVKKELKLDSEQKTTIERKVNPIVLRFISFEEFVAPEDPKKQSGLAQYLGEISKVHDALPSIEQSDSKTAVQGIVGGGSNELVQSYKNTDKLLQQLDSDIRKTLSPLLLQPYENVFAGVMARAQSDFNNRWKTSIFDPCTQSIGGRYPFKRGGDDASLNDVADFFHPQNGSLWKFYEKELKPFIDDTNDRWTEKKWLNVGLGFSPEFLHNLQTAELISSGLFPRGSADPLLSFDLYPYPSPGVSEIIISVSGKEVRYRNEPQEWHPLAWPGTSETSGAAIMINAGGSRQGYQFPGRWGLFKLLDTANIVQLNPTKYRVEWTVKIQDEKIVKIRFDLRAQNLKNPFKPGLLSEFHCLARL
jgi:type VI secretion system protein ImpL